MDGRGEPGWQDWRLPGYRVLRRVGVGGSGAVWLAVEHRSGDLVALKRLRPGADPAARREAAALAALEHPHLVRLRRVLPDGAGLVLVLDHAAGGSLADLLDRRGRLRPGELVTALAPVAAALAAAHAQLLVHADVSPGNVLLDAAGRPLLADLGTSRLAGGLAGQPHGTAGYVAPEVAAGAPPGPPADVYGVAAVAWRGLTGRCVDEVWVADRSAAAVAAGAPEAMAGLLAAALDADPAARPSATAFEQAMLAALPAEPLTLAGGPSAAAGLAVTGPVAAPAGTGPADASEIEQSSGGGRHRRRPATRPRRPRARRWWSPRRWVARAALTAVAVGVAAVAGLAWGAAARSTPSAEPALPVAAPPLSASRLPPSPADTPDPDWAAVLDRLDATRAAAFAGADQRLLDGVYAPGSSPLAEDGQELARLAAAGRTATAVRHRLVSVLLTRRDGDRVVLRMVDRLPPYEIRRRDGTVLASQPGRGERMQHVELAMTSAGWRIAAVEPL